MGPDSITCSNPASSGPPPRRSPHVMIVAGEVSGDMHAAALVDAVKALDPSISFSGLGGPRMKDAGVAIDEDLTTFAVVGFWEVLKHYAVFRRLFDEFLNHVTRRKPAAVILVDYPGFNLRLAARLKAMGVRVIYYISPQVWAWKENRVKFIRDHIDIMMVLFEFEKKFYADRGVRVDFVGHPLVDHLWIPQDRETVLRQSGLSPDKLTIGILPGSREKEIEWLLPPMLDAARILQQEDPRFQFLILKSPNLKMELFEKFLTNSSLNVKILDGHFYEGLNACDAGMVASGTATLQTAMLLKPMVVVYKTSFFTYLLAKALIRISFIALVNVVAGRAIVPECLQDRATGPVIAAELKKIIRDPARLDRMKAELERVKISLGVEGASRRAAQIIIRAIQ